MSQSGYGNAHSSSVIEIVSKYEEYENMSDTGTYGEALPSVQSYPSPAMMGVSSPSAGAAHCSLDRSLEAPAPRRQQAQSSAELQNEQSVHDRHH
jgi:hypothetical protein